MPDISTLTPLVEHPDALHLRRMRIAVWLYLALLGRLPAGETTLTLDPAEIARAMGLHEGTIRSWLGHLRKAGYIGILKTSKDSQVRILPVGPATGSRQGATEPRRFFTVGKLQEALGEPGNQEALAAALGLYPDPVIRRALAGALAVPAPEIKKSRTALFLYLAKRHGNTQ